MHWALTPASVASMSISRKSKPKLASQAVQLVPPTHTQGRGVVGTRETNHGNSAETEGTESVVRGQRTQESETGRAVYHHSAGKDRAPPPLPHAFNNSSKRGNVHRERSRGHWEAPTHNRTSGTACLGRSRGVAEPQNSETTHTPCTRPDPSATQHTVKRTQTQQVVLWCKPLDGRSYRTTR